MWTIFDYFFIFSYIFRERLESESGSSFYYSWLFEKEMRIFNFVARVLLRRRENALSSAEKSPGNEIGK